MVVPLRNYYRDAATPIVAEWTSVQTLLRTHKAQWKRLADAALEPNAFYSPDYLEASARMDGEDIRCIAVFEDGRRDSDMLGLFPVARARITDGALIPALEFYRNDYVCLTTPLISAADPIGTCDVFLDRLAHAPAQPRQVFGRLMPSSDGVTLALKAALAQRGLAMVTFDDFERPAILPPARFEEAFRRLGGSKRTRVGRRRRQLRAAGSVNFSVVKGEQTKAAIEDFMRLEASGWKGAAGSALMMQSETAAFARSVFGNSSAEIDVLSFDGRMIAAVASVVAKGTLYTVKSAYDETFANYSPGTLLDVHLLRRVSGSGYRQIDSCALADHPVGGYWMDRKAIQSIGFASQTTISQARLDQSITLLTNTRRLKNWLRETIWRS